jgi:hypothetical protein
MKPTLIDRYKELGTPGDLLLLLFLGIVIYGLIIHFRKLDQRWRKSFFIASLLPVGAGIAAVGIDMMASIHFLANCARGLGAPEDPMYVLAGGMLIARFAAWLTIILLVFSAVLFITGKNKERRTSGTPEVERDDSHNSEAI